MAPSSAHPHGGDNAAAASGSSSSAQRDAGTEHVQRSNGSPHPQAADSSAPRTEQELAQAFRDLARGEQAATALEANLTNLESKLDELLASFEGAADDTQPATNGGEGDGSGKSGAAGDDPNKVISGTGR